MQIWGGIDEATLKSMTTTAIVWAIVFLAATVFVALTVKRGTAIGIASGIVNALSIALTPKYLESFHELEFFKTIYGTADELDDLVAEYYAQQIPKMITFYAVTFLMLAGFILGLVFIIKNLSASPKIVAIIALVLQIVRYVFIAPIKYTAMFTGSITIEEQISQANTYYIFTVLPALLLVVLAVIALVNKGKGTAAPVEAPAAEAAPVEAPAEAPAAEAAPVEETVEAPAEDNSNVNNNAKPTDF